MQLDMARILQVFIIQGIILIFFTYIAICIISRGRSKLNITFSLFYICIVVAAVVNMIYALILDESIVLILNFIVNFFVAFGLIFLLSFNYQILKSKFEFTIKKQMALILVYAILLAFMAAFLPFGGVIINESTGWKPVWSLIFFLYVIIVVSIVAMIPTIYTSLKIYSGFESKDIRKRWILYFVGMCGFFSYMYGAFYINYLNDPSIRLIFSIYGITVFLWAYLVYYGVGKQLSSE